MESMWTEPVVGAPLLRVPASAYVMSFMDRMSLTEPSLLSRASPPTPLSPQSLLYIEKYTAKTQYQSHDTVFSRFIFK